jgi:hypothetical protein
MHSYFVSQSNIITVRTNEICSRTIQLKLQNMYSYENYSASLSQDAAQFAYDEYNSILTFSASISGAVIGDQYRAEIYDNSNDNLVWNGTIQVFADQAVTKSAYTNQIPLESIYVSKESNNEYLILE